MELKNDARWMFLSTLTAAVIATTCAMSSKWLHISNASDYYVRDWGVGQNLVAFTWFAIVAMTVGIAFAMLVGKRRQYLPSTVPIAIATCATVALIGVGLLIHRAAQLEIRQWEFEVTAVDYHQPTVAKASDALFFMLAGYLSIASSAMCLWWLARMSRMRNEVALAHANAALAAMVGDVIPDREPTPPVLEPIEQL